MAVFLVGIEGAHVTVFACVATIIPSSALELCGKTAPSSRIILGMAGCGGMGTSNTNSFLALPECRVIVACDDVDKNHFNTLVQTVNRKYKNMYLIATRRTEKF